MCVFHPNRVPAASDIIRMARRCVDFIEVFVDRILRECREHILHCSAPIHVLSPHHPTFFSSLFFSRMVSRLNSYASDHPSMFRAVVDMVSVDFVHIIERQVS